MFYYCLILTSISLPKTLFNSFSIIILFKSFSLFVIYTIHLSMVRPRSCRVIYYFDTRALGIRHQLFDRVSTTIYSINLLISHFNKISTKFPFNFPSFRHLHFLFSCIITIHFFYHIPIVKHTFRSISSIINRNLIFLSQFQ
jgi:hypothetical protein